MQFPYPSVFTFDGVYLQVYSFDVSNKKTSLSLVNYVFFFFFIYTITALYLHMAKI